MGYTIIDLLEKIIIIEQKGYEMYKAITLMEDIDEKIKVVARILASEEERHMQLYKKLKNEIKAETIPSIDFDIYDKASNLINSFRYPHSEHMVDIQQLLRFALDFEEQSISLLISIRGLLVRGSDSAGTLSYNVLAGIIKEEQKHIENIERFLH